MYPSAAITAALAASIVLRQSFCMRRMASPSMPVSCAALSLPGPSSEGPATPPFSPLRSSSNHSSSMKLPCAFGGTVEGDVGGCGGDVE